MDSVPIARLRTQARVLAMQSTKGKSQEAIRLLEEVVRREPGAAEDRFVLARLFEIEGDWAKADAQMRWLIDNNPSVPAYRIRYILALLRNKRAGETGPWLDQLEKLQPEAPLVQQLRAMALSEQGKGDEAVELLRTFAQKHEEQAGFAAQVLEAHRPCSGGRGGVTPVCRAEAGHGTAVRPRARRVPGPPGPDPRGTGPVRGRLEDLPSGDGGRRLLRHPPRRRPGRHAGPPSRGLVEGISSPGSPRTPNCRSRWPCSGPSRGDIPRRRPSTARPSPGMRTISWP